MRSRGRSFLLSDQYKRHLQRIRIHTASFTRKKNFIFNLLGVLFITTAVILLLTSSPTQNINILLDPSTKHPKYNQFHNANDYPPLQCNTNPFHQPSYNQHDEMVYWKKIQPHDASFQSPYINDTTERFLTFEPDDAGWNNVRMGFETILVLAMITGRTLVLPPNQAYGNIPGVSQTFNFHNIYNLTALMDQYETLKIITMEDYLTHYGQKGTLKDQSTSQPLYPPQNKVNWNQSKSISELYDYLRMVAYNPLQWKPGQCLAAFPDPINPPRNLETHLQNILNEVDGRPPPKPHHFYQSPTPVFAPPMERLREALADRTKLCLYSPEIQTIPNIHFPMDYFQNVRLLSHFYTFLFHENYHQDLFTKRFIRDGLRYNNDISCAASKIVQAIRQRAKERNPTSNPHGDFDSFHIRRNDFQSQFHVTQGDISKIVELSKTQIRPGSTVYIATDEMDETFFEPMKQIYDLVFSHDFQHLFPPSITPVQSSDLHHHDGIQDYHWRMIDQMVAARGRIFHGLFYSTFSGHVMRLRGYYSTKETLDKSGSLKNSFYYMPRHARNEMQEYRAVRLPSFMREYPVSWRDIDYDVERLKEG